MPKASSGAAWIRPPPRKGPGAALPRRSRRRRRPDWARGPERVWASPGRSSGASAGMLSPAPPDAGLGRCGAPEAEAPRPPRPTGRGPRRMGRCRGARRALPLGAFEKAAGAGRRWLWGPGPGALRPQAALGCCLPAR